MTHEGYAAVVYDLDGTLVRLAVEWAAVREDVAAVYREAGHDPGGTDLWGLLERADEVGGDLPARVNEAIAARERAGARRSERLPLADEVTAVAADRPVGVVSLNAASACRIALAEHDLTDAVSVVVGRDSHERRKPHPGPLLSALEQLGVPPERALFVGDSERDRECAERAGVAYEHVGAPGGG